MEHGTRRGRAGAALALVLALVPADTSCGPCSLLPCSYWASAKLERPIRHGFITVCRDDECAGGPLGDAGTCGPFVGPLQVGRCEHYGNGALVYIAPLPVDTFRYTMELADLDSGALIETERVMRRSDGGGCNCDYEPAGLSVLRRKP